MTTRRDLLKSFLAAGALAGLGRQAFAVQPVRRVPLGLLLDPDTAAGRGARLGLEEAQRAGQLLHVDISAAPTSEYALIGLAVPKEEPKALFLAVGPPAQGAEPIRPHVYLVSASPAFRRQALDRHKDRKDLKVVDWQPDLTKFGADALNLRFRRRFNQPMDEAAWRGWMGVKLAAELALRYPGTSAGAAATDKVGELSLDGHKGMPLRFDPKDHHLIQPVYLVDGQGKVVDEVAPEWKE
ncbi:MAG TPA: hypothetical protein VGM86_02625 [Thermoanaerobaculia bacterium]|jgi:hypothetical protein